MKDRDVRRFERIQRVKTFLGNHSGDFAPAGVLAQTIPQVDAVIAGLNEARVGQVRTPLTKGELIDALFVIFKDISRTARSIATSDPGFPVGDFRTPSDDSENITTTHADFLLNLLEDDIDQTVEEAEARIALRAKFTDYEMDPDFVVDLRAARDSLTAANTGKHTDNQEGLEATAAIATLLAEAQTLVTRLHGPIQNKYKSDPDKIHAWKQASRVESDPVPTPAPVTPTP